MTRNVATVIVLLVLVTGSCIMMLAARDLPGGTAPGAVGPRTVPVYTFTALLVGSLIVASLEWRDVRRRQATQPTGTSEAESDMDGPVFDETAGDEGTEQSGVVRPLLVAVWITGFVTLWNLAGFFPTSVLFVASLSYYLAPVNARSLTKSLIVAVVFAGLAWILFRLLLGVPLPTGSLWDR